MLFRAHLFAARAGAVLRRTVGVCACAVCAIGAMGATGAGCGSIELQPIKPPPAVDAGLPEVGAPRVLDAGSACKRGIAANDAPTAVLAPSAASAASPGIAWWYNWTTESPPGGDPRVEYVPMVWGAGSLDQTLPAGARFLLGFNEPNFKAQADLTVQQAVADWPAVESRARAAGIPIVSPGVNFCGSSTDTSQCTEPGITDPYTYLADFFAACAGCEVDYVAVHAYVCDVASLQAYIEGNMATGGTLAGFLQFGKPIWVTEIACDATHSVADQKAFMQAAVPYLENNPQIVRYAWFNAMPIPNALLTNADGSLTDLGTTYVGLPASCP